jgi:hypothetical protein
MRNKLRNYFLLASSILAMSIGQARTQTYSMDWFKISGGGGTSAGAGYSMSGTIGQLDAGAMSGGNSSVAGGFWGGIAAVPAQGTPTLSITRNPANGLITISWPLPASGFLLEQTATLTGAPFQWPQLSPPYQTNATHIFITVPSPTGNRFYRLHKP